MSSILSRVQNGVRAVFGSVKSFDPFVYVSRASRGADAELRNPYAQSVWVSSGVRALARYSASVPLLVKTGKKSDREGDPLPSDSAWQKLFDRPSLGVSAYKFFDSIASYRALYGEVFLVAYGEGGEPFKRGGIPREILVMDPRSFTAQSKDGVLLGWKSDRLKIALTVDQVGLIASFNPDDETRGLSPLQCVAVKLGYDIKVDAYNSGLLSNGADPGGILYSDTVLPPKMVAELRAQWEDRHQGSIKASRLAILSAGLKYVPSEIRPKDMAFGQMLDRNRDAILAAIGVNMFDIGAVVDFNRASALAAKALTWESTIVPNLTMIEDVLWSWLFEPYSATQAKDFWANFDLSKVEALQPNMTERLQQASSLVLIGYTADQANERLGLGMPETTKEVEVVEADASDPALEPTATVADSAMNGAQVTSLLSIIQSVADGSLPAESAIAALVVAFPTIDPEEAKRIIEPAAKLAEDRPDQEPESAPSKAMTKAFQSKTARQVVAVRRRLMQFEKRRAEEILERLKTLNRLSVRANDEGIAPLTEAEMNAVLGTPEKWSKDANEYLDGVMDPVAKYALNSAKSQFGGFEVVDVTDPKWLLKASKQTASLVKVEKARRAAFRSILIKAFEEKGAGSIDDISRRLEKAFGEEIPSSADTVARTESAMLVQDVKSSAATEEGFTHKTWTTSGDGAVRESHARIDGETVILSAKFSNGLDYPSQMGGPAEEVINCRCDVVYRIMD